MLNQTRALWGIARESILQGPGISPVEMQTCLRLKRVTPRWCKEDDHKAICRMSLGAYMASQTVSTT
jgi:hypothetical protein